MVRIKPRQHEQLHLDIGFQHVKPSKKKYFKKSAPKPYKKKYRSQYYQSYDY